MSNQSCLNNLFRFRGRIAGCAGLVLLAWALGSPIHAGVFSWEDEEGKTHFTDDPRKIPPKYRTKNKGMKEYEVDYRPSLVRPDDQSSSSGPARTVRLNPTDPPASPNATVVPLISNGGGNYLVEAMINGETKARLMVDTGASMVTLSRSLAKELGLLTPDMPEIPFTTAGGIVWMPLVALDSLSVGEAQAPNVEASITDDMGDLDGLLGMSFLGDYRVEMDQVSARMILKPLGQPGEQFWDGKPASWWENRFSEYDTRIKSFRIEAINFMRSGHPKAKKLMKMVDFYRELRHELDLRASRAGVPQKLRR